jgi:hypothetical protein
MQRRHPGPHRPDHDTGRHALPGPTTDGSTGPASDRRHWPARHISRWSTSVRTSSSNKPSTRVVHAGSHSSASARTVVCGAMAQLAPRAGEQLGRTITHPLTVTSIGPNGPLHRMVLPATETHPSRTRFAPLNKVMRAPPCHASGAGITSATDQHPDRAARARDGCWIYAAASPNEATTHPPARPGRYGRPAPSSAPACTTWTCATPPGRATAPWSSPTPRADRPDLAAPPRPGRARRRRRHRTTRRLAHPGDHHPRQAAP